MKKYVILTPAIGGMGGSQMFCNNKAKCLKQSGWEVILIYFQNFDILISDLKQYSSLWAPKLSYGIQYVLPSQRANIVASVSEYIGSFDECVIESHMVKLAMWGELIAEQLSCIHILNPIEEELHPLSDGYTRFMEYKLKRHELLNSSETSLKRFFRTRYKEEYENYFFTMIPYCSNVTIENDEEFNPIKADYTILSIGRLEKPYILPMIDEICSFCISVPEKKINVIFIGASSSGIVEKQISLKMSSSNCNVYLIGYKYPVPSVYLECADAAIACANSVLVAANKGVPTIVVDAYDYDAIGLYGYTTMRLLQRDDEPRVKISSLLKEVLIDSKYEKKQSVESTDVDAIENIRLQIEYALRSLKNVRKYYKVADIYSLKDYIYCNIKRIGHIIFQR